MPTQLFDIRVSKDGEFIEAFALNQANLNQLMSVLTIAPSGAEIIIIKK